MRDEAVRKTMGWMVLGWALLSPGMVLAADEPLVSWESDREPPRRVVRGAAISSFERAPLPSPPAPLRQFDIEEETLPVPPVEVRVELE